MEKYASSADQAHPPWVRSRNKVSGVTRRQFWYENDSLTKNSTYDLVIICNHKQGHYSDRRICEMMTLNDICYNPATSSFWLVIGLALKHQHTHDMPLRIESTERHTHQKQAIVVHHYMKKEDWRLQSQSHHVYHIM